MSVVPIHRKVVDEKWVQGDIEKVSMNDHWTRDDHKEREGSNDEDGKSEQQQLMKPIELNYLPAYFSVLEPPLLSLSTRLTATNRMALVAPPSAKTLHFCRLQHASIRYK